MLLLKELVCNLLMICYVMIYEYTAWRSISPTSIELVVSADSLMVECLLELLDDDGLRKDTALPSLEWSSDHIALLAEFRCKPRNRR